MFRHHTGFVYFIQAPINGILKIGYTREMPEKRLASIAAHSPVPLIRLGLIRGSVQFERKLHRRFDHHRDHYEWFRPGRDLLDFIQEHAWPWEPHASREMLDGMPDRNSEKAILALKDWVDLADAPKVAPPAPVVQYFRVPPPFGKQIKDMTLKELQELYWKRYRARRDVSHIEKRILAMGGPKPDPAQKQRVRQFQREQEERRLMRIEHGWPA